MASSLSRCFVIMRYTFFGAFFCFTTDPPILRRSKVPISRQTAYFIKSMVQRRACRKNQPTVAVYFVSAAFVFAAGKPMNTARQCVSVRQPKQQCSALDASSRLCICGDSTAIYTEHGTCCSCRSPCGRCEARVCREFLKSYLLAYTK